jgi:uncharacterized metal-binding protein
MTEWKAGENTHENLIYVCSGGLSNTGLTAALATIEVLKELGLKKVGIGCLAALPAENPSVLGKTRAAKKVITVDGCPIQCAKKIVEDAGFNIAESIVLTKDIDMKKKALHEDIGGDLKSLMDYIATEDIDKAKQVIRDAITQE